MFKNMRKDLEDSSELNMHIASAEDLSSVSGTNVRSTTTYSSSSKGSDFFIFYGYLHTHAHTHKYTNINK